MERTQVQLTRDQLVQLRELAYRRGVSVARLVREAVDVLLSDPRTAGVGDAAVRVMASAGRFDSGRSDVSERHDDYIVEAIHGDDVR